MAKGYLNKMLSVIFEDLEGKMPLLVQMLTSRKSIWSPLRKYPREEVKQLVAAGQWPPADIRDAADAFIRDVAQFDPHPRDQYMRYLIKQVATGMLKLPEDGALFREMLETFMSKGRDWPGQDDVFKYKNWRELQKITNEYASSQATKSVGSTRSVLKQVQDAARKGSKVVFEQDYKTRSVDGDIVMKVYKIVECTNWEAVFLYGRGTQWCTSASIFRDRPVRNTTLVQAVQAVISEFLGGSTHNRGKDLTGTPWEGWSEDDFAAEIYRLNGWPRGTDLNTIKVQSFKAPNPYVPSAKSQAESYLNAGPLYIVYKEDEPYMQFTRDGFEMRNVEDTMLSWASPALGRVLVDFMQGGTPTDEWKSNVEPKVKEGIRQWKKQTGQA